MLTLDEYRAYGDASHDDAPFAIYDSEVFDDDPTAVLATEYSPPPLFAADAFAVLPAAERPPWRW